MATYDELASILGYDILDPMYRDLGGQGNPFYAANEEGGPGQYLDARMAQVYGFDPSFFAPYNFDFQQSGPGNSGTLSAFDQGGNALGSWSQYDTPFSETLRDAALTAGAAFGGLGLAGAGPLGGALGGTFSGAGSLGIDGAAVGGGWGGAGATAGAGLAPAGGSAFGGLGGAVGGIGAGAGAAAGGGAMDLGGFLNSMGGNSLVNLGGNLLNGYLGSQAAGKASDAQLAALQQSNELQKYMYDTTRNDWAPYREAGTDALSQIQNLLQNPDAIKGQADYQFGLNEGRNNLENSASARGMTYSGQQAKALTQFGNDYAGSKLNESYNRLAGIAGIGQQATGSTQTAGSNYANQAGNNLTDMGNARASGYMGQANSWGNAFGNSLNNYNQQWANQQYGLPGRP